MKIILFLYQKIYRYILGGNSYEQHVSSIKLKIKCLKFFINKGYFSGISKILDLDFLHEINFLYELYQYLNKAASVLKHSIVYYDINNLNKTLCIIVDEFIEKENLLIHQELNNCQYFEIQIGDTYGIPEKYRGMNKIFQKISPKIYSKLFVESREI